ncbi:hypothetical protein ABZV14_05840 [Streptosporangium canum]|uniref:hypothetical protein n=1 Tax=Streptosporangium canum TaxID=324952 RepID=UPI0033B08ACE
MTLFSIFSDWNAVGVCRLCNEVFGLNKSHTAVILIDPETNMPPEWNPETGQLDRPLTADMLDRVKRYPVCPDCVAKVNAERTKGGLPLWEG